MIDPDRLAKLLQPADPALTVYVDLTANQRDLRRQEAGLRALVEQARAQLVEYGTDNATGSAMLQPLEALANSNLADHRDPALALFITASAVETVALPSSLPTLVLTGRTMHIKPLLPWVARNRLFHILALSSTRVRLLSATPYRWEERTLEALPAAVQAELDSLPAGDPAALAAERIRLIAEDPNRIVHAVRAALGPDAGPIVLAAEAQIAGHFTKAAHLPDVLPSTVAVNPFALTDEELHARALAAIDPALNAEPNAVLEQVQARLGTAQSNVAIRLEEILAAGVEGRVDAGVVASDEMLWGRYTPGKVVAADGHRAPGDEDLLNLAAVQAMRTGGRAFARPRADLPREVPAAATLRF